MDWANRRVLITGATGLVGHALTEALLERGATVCCLVRDYHSTFLHTFGQKVEIVTGSLESSTIERALCAYACDVVFHLAAQTLVGVAARAPLLTFESNIRGTYHLLEACRRQKAHVQRVIIASSDKAYGTAPLPYTEKVPLQGEFPYDVSKTCTDLLAQSYFHTYSLPIAIVRCGNIYGPHDLNWSRIVPGTIRSLLHQEPPLIRSDGTLIRDYFYVKDAALAYLAAAEENGIGEAYNFGSQEPCTVLQLVKTIADLMQSDLEPIILDEVHGEIEEQFLNCSKAKAQLGWSPRYTLEEGLKETIEWYANNRHADRGLETASV